MKVAGAVLSGGASRRMGRTKALIDLDGRMMGDRVLDALRAAGAQPVVLVGGDVDELAELSAPVLVDRYPGDGPVGGVITALRRTNEIDGIEAVFVLACDLPWITASTLSSVMIAADADPTAEVWVGRGERVEPLVALWSVAALPALEDAFASGERGLHAVIAALDHRWVHLDVEPDDLRNVNTPDDLPAGSAG